MAAAAARLAVASAANEATELEIPTLQPAPRDVPLPAPAPPPPSPPEVTAPGGVFSSLLLGGGTSEPQPPPPPPPADAAPAAAPSGGGLFTSLLMSASDLDLSGKRAPIMDPPGSDPPMQKTVPMGVTAELGLPPLTIAQSAITTAEITLPPPETSQGQDTPAPVSSLPAAAPSTSGSWDIANTGMLLGPADPLAPMSPPPPGLTGLNIPTTGVILDQATFSDRDFEAMLGGSFSPQAAEPSGEHSLPDQWVVSNPPSPPPLRRARQDQSVPPPPPKKAAANPTQMLAGLAPIPSVASLGAAPRLLDGVGMGRVVGLVLAGLLLGGLAGAALAPAPPRPPTAGPEGALHKLSEARRLMAQGKDSEAAALLVAALALDKNQAEAQRDLGVALARQERYEEAARAYELYLEMAPRAPDAFAVEGFIKQYRAGAKP